MSIDCSFRPRDFGIAKPGKILRAGALRLPPKSAWSRLFALLLAAGLVGVAAPALRAGEVPDVAVEGTMPEDLVPGLRDLVRTALKQSPTMLQQAIAVTQAQIQITANDANLMPHAYFNGGYSISREEVSETGVTSQPSSSKGLTYGLGASQNFFSWGQYIDASRIARIQHNIAERQYAMAYLALVQQIRDTYLGLIIAKGNIRTARYNLQMARAARAMAEEQLKHGDISASAISVPQLAEADAKVGLDTAEESYLHGKRTLMLMCGIKELSDDSIPQEIPAPTYSEIKAKALLASILRQEGRSFFQEQVYEMQIKADKLNFDVAATGMLPKFSLSAGYSLNRFNSFSAGPPDANGRPTTLVTQEGVTSVNYGLNASWTIFDGLATHANKEAALENRRSHERSLQEYVDRTAEEAQDVERQLNISVQSEAISDTRASYAASSVKQVQSQYQYGSTSKTSVDAAIYDLYGAQYLQSFNRSQVFSHWCRLVDLAGADPIMNYLPVRYVRDKR